VATISVDPDLIAVPERAVDPVCLETVEAPEEWMSVTFAGARYYFCGDACRQAFKRDARGYADGAPEAAHRPPDPPASTRSSPFEVLPPGVVDDAS
jgi:YHS domain-containing protein